MHRLALILLLSLPLWAQKVNLQRNVTGTLPVANGGTASTTATGARTSLSTPYLQVGTSLPATCTVGTDLYFKTDAIAGQNLYGCTATDTWTLQSSGGSATLDPGTLTEIVKPSAPSVNGLKIYALDVSGVTYLCVQNSDAAEICIAPAGITTSSTDPGAIEFKNQTGTLAAGSATGRTAIGTSSSGIPVWRTYGGTQKTALDTTALDTYGDVTGLWASGTCSGYLKSDGTCDTPSFDVFSRTVVQEWDDFYSGDGSEDFKLDWDHNGATGCLFYGSTDAEEFSHPGAAIIRTDNASNWCALSIGGSYRNNHVFKLASNANWEFRWIFKSPNTATTAFGTRVGLWSDDTNFYGWYMEGVVGTDTNWLFKAVRSGETDSVDSTVALTANHWYTLRIRSTSAGTVLFSIADGTGAFSTEKSICSSGCDAAHTLNDDSKAPFFAVLGDGSNHHSLTMDFYGYKATISR